MHSSSVPSGNVKQEGCRNFSSASVVLMTWKLTVLLRLYDAEQLISFAKSCDYNVDTLFGEKYFIFFTARSSAELAQSLQNFDPQKSVFGFDVARNIYFL